jgi:hypothetical protein
MLQHNAPEAGRRAHIAHAALIGLHAICCGMPALAVAAAALAGATSGIALFSESVGVFHHILHAHELWILGLSAALVVIGGILETGARRKGGRLGFPWLYAFSVACFVANIAIIAVHRA